MALVDGISAAAGGLASAQSGFEDAAVRLNRALSGGGSDRDVVRAVVDLIGEQAAFDANAATVSRLDETSEALLDILA